MTKTVEFVSQVKDLSTDKGYQFEFHCDKCGKGYTSTYQTATLGVAASLLDTAGGVFESMGSILGKVRQAAKGVENTLGGKAHSDAYAAAVEEVKPQFKHCPRCGHWVCLAACWNADAGLCDECAPNVTEELVSKQTHATVEQIGQKLSGQDLLKGLDVTTPAQVVQCAHCGTDIKAGAKFCGACGQPVTQPFKAAFCAQCGAKLAGEKFCPSCGKPAQ